MTTPAAPKGTRRYTKGTFQIWQHTPRRHSIGLLPGPIMQSHIQSLGRNQAITATPDGQSWSPPARGAAQVTYLDGEDRGKVALAGQGWLGQGGFPSPGSKAQEPPPPRLQHPLTPMQPAQGWPIPHMDTPPAHVNDLFSSPRSFLPPKTTWQSLALLTQALCTPPPPPLALGGRQEDNGNYT